MSKNTFVSLLLRLYPRAWRSEYGGELAVILADRQFTPSIIVDVVLCGIRQRFRYAEVWQVDGAVLALWLLIGTVANSISPLPRSAYNHFFQINWIAELAIGYIYVSHYSRPPAAAALFSAKASLLGIIPELLLAVLWTVNLIHPTILGMDGVPHVHGHLITDFCLRTEATVSPATLMIAIPVTVIPAFLLGLAGGTLARSVSAPCRRFGTIK